MPVWTVVVAAGRGERFGGPKQYEQLGARRVLDHAVDLGRRGGDGVVLVVPPDRVGDAEPGADAVVAGADSRSGSVRAGLAAVPPSADVVVVHDAARPFASDGLFAAVVQAVRDGADGAVPGVPVVDTVKQVEPTPAEATPRIGAGRSVVATLPRAELVAVQTPQAFAADVLRAAHATDDDATDDAALVERHGGRVVVVPGEPANVKITGPADLRPAAATARVGVGFDVHAWADEPGRPLVLGGVQFEGERGLAGHSDADAVAHAVADALLGAGGLDDLGTLFPDTDPAWAGADSLDLLREVVRRLRDEGWVPANVDCAVVLEAPKLTPRRAEMQGALAAVVGAPVSVKGKRAEGLGALGRGEGVACWAVALVHSSLGDSRTAVHLGDSGGAGS